MRRHIFIVACIAAAMAIVYAFAKAGDAPHAAISSRELPQPNVPELLPGSADSTDYVLVRFWDALDFADPASGSRDTAFIERGFLRFAGMLRQASSDSVRAAAVDTLLRRASADSLALDLLSWVAEANLNATDSPSYSEGAYIMFLKWLAQSSSIDPAMRERYAAQLSDMDRNRPGDIAADFSYTSLNGTSSTLLSLVAAHDSTLVVLYDPDCGDCHVLIDLLGADTLLRDAVDSGTMAVMALYPYDDTELWRRTAGDIPSWWITARTDSPIEDEGTYYLPRTPRTYLLDRSGRILRVRE
ncbi:DUF5106 domain-containing protein [uncultured Muribaculum sp.]|uniref:DUF5106 domain-containing protein n=1 Tax=uncultured Muribaculum sp. TaxID=1918613 RepID=UPI0025E364C1|nr:DUF5106 domain-containing protein [uncultured Muribaculum sp.]